MDYELNQYERKILNLIEESPHTISSIKRELNLDYKNAWRYCRKLYDQELVDLIPPPNKTKKGKPVFVKLKIKDTERDYVLKVLEEIKKRKKVDLKEYATLFQDGLNYAERLQMNSVIFKLPFITPPLIKREISLTPEGEKFLKEHSKK